jgi:hypothetical protein
MSYSSPQNLSQPIYTIQLLNDLHNHFPEILYNPGRFQNVSDILLYIRGVAYISPYERGFQQYMNPSTLFNIRNSIPLSSVRTTASATTATTATTPTTGIRTTTGVRTDTRFTTPPAQSNVNTSALINTLLGSLFGDIIGSQIEVIGANDPAVQAFLNQNVPVFPTEEEINRSSTVYTADALQDDICAICQDDIEENQIVRRLNHCHHSFHSNCIDVWFTTNVHCPTCRHDIRDISAPAPVPVPVESDI